MSGSDRADLAARLTHNAMEFRAIAKGGRPIQTYKPEAWDQAALTCEQAATALSAEGGAQDAKVIQLGEGDWIINHGYLGEDAALFIEAAPERGTVGADANESGINKTSVAPGGIVIAISNLAAAEVLSDELQKAIKRIGTRRGMGPLPSGSPSTPSPQAPGEEGLAKVEDLLNRISDDAPDWAISPLNNGQARYLLDLAKRRLSPSVVPPDGYVLVTRNLAAIGSEYPILDTITVPASFVRNNLSPSPDLVAAAKALEDGETLVKLVIIGDDKAYVDLRNRLKALAAALRSAGGE